MYKFKITTLFQYLWRRYCCFILFIILTFPVTAESSWTNQVIGEVGSFGWFTDVAIDSSNYVHAVFLSDSYRELNYASNVSGEWKSEIIHTGEKFEYQSIAIDSKGKVHIVFFDSKLYEVVYITNKSNQWETSRVYKGSSGFAYDTDIVIDSKDYVHIVFYENVSPYYVKYTNNKSGNWDLKILDSELTNAVDISMAIDYKDNIHISYNAGYEIRYANNVSENWDVEILDDPEISTSSGVSMAVDLDGYAHVAYKNDNISKLKYASNKSGNWKFEQISDKANDNIYNESPSIVIDSNGYAHVFYRDDNYQLIHSTNITGLFENDIVDDSSGRVGYYIASAIDSLDFIHVTYVLGNPDYVIKYATNSTANPTPAPTPTSTPTPTPTPTTTPSPTGDAVAYYPFDGDASDESGNGNNGTVNGATLTTDRYGNSNSAYSFDGVNDYISTVSMSSGDKTMSLWIKPANDMSSGDGLFMGFPARTESRFYLGYKPSNFWIGLGEGGSTDILLFDTSAKWHHFALVSDGQEGLVYQNGVYAGKTTWTGLNDGDGGKITIGKAGGSLDVYFEGSVDDVRIYNRALSASEIQELASGSVSPTPTPTPIVTPTPGQTKDCSSLLGVSSDGLLWKYFNSNWENLPGILEEIATGDISGDGTDDVIGITSNNYIFYTDDLNNWELIPGFLSEVATGDLDGDNDEDIVGLAPNGSIWYSKDLFVWSYIPGFLSKVAVGDFNNDGSGDLIGVASDSTIWYTFNLSDWSNLPGFLSEVATGDLNGDGIDDVVGLAPNGSIWYSTNFSNWTNVPGFLSKVTIGDINNDGFDDLIGLAYNNSIWYTLDLSNWHNIPGFLTDIESLCISTN